MAQAKRAAADRGAELIVAPEDPGEVELRAPGRFQRRNFALACAAAKAFIGNLDPASVASVASTLTVPGRLERVGEDPAAFIDVAHNPDGAVALAEGLAEIAAGRPVIACIAALADKDAGGMIRALAPVLSHVVCTELDAAALASRGLSGVTSHSAAKLAHACRDVGLSAEQVPDFGTAVRLACRLAAEQPDGILLVTGSHYVLVPARAVLLLCEDASDGSGV
jgi:folylpolyglutamate synthase/dihydropteroate synthase